MKTILIIILLSLNSYASSNLVKAKTNITPPTPEELIVAKSSNELLVKCDEDIKASLKDKLSRKAELLGVKATLSTEKSGVKIIFTPEFLSEDNISQYLNTLLD